MRRNRHEIKESSKELKVEVSNKTGPALKNVTKKEGQDEALSRDFLDVPIEYKKRINDLDRDYEHMNK